MSKKVDKGVNQAGIWRKGIPGNRDSQCKGPGVGICLVCLGHSQAARETREDEREARGRRLVQTRKGGHGGRP